MGLNRFANKKDEATLQTISIIGKKKYKQLLDFGLVVVDYNIIKENKKRHHDRVEKLTTTVKILSTLIDQQETLLSFGHPNGQSR